MTIRQQGGIFGRNPTFNTVTATQFVGPISGLATSAAALKSSATTGLMQITGPAAGATRTMTTPDANFTAARTDAAQSFTGDQTLTDGNLVVSNGKGIDFSATPGTGTRELFDDYEEGTWTPTLTNLTVGNGSYARGFYTKIGRLVHISFDFTFGSTTVATGGDIQVSGLPFAAAGSGHGAAYFLDSGTAQYTVPAVLPTSSSSNALIAASSNASDQSITNTKPFTWAVDDRLNFAMTYITS